MSEASSFTLSCVVVPSQLPSSFINDLWLKAADTYDARNLSSLWASAADWLQDYRSLIPRNLYHKVFVVTSFAFVIASKLDLRTAFQYPNFPFASWVVETVESQAPSLSWRNLQRVLEKLIEVWQEAECYCSR